MTNIALLALALTLAQEAATEPAPPPAPAPAAEPLAQPTPPVKPPESDIEVLTEVVDLEETQVQDPAAGWYGQSYPVPDRHLSLLTARTLRAGGFEFMIEHRSGTAIYDRDSGTPFADMWNNLLGLDNALQVGLALRYGILDGLDAGIYRAGSSRADTYEFDARYRIASQEQLGVDLAVRGGLTWFVQPQAADAHGFFGQLFATRLLANRVLVTGAALYHSNSTNGTKYNQDKAWSVAGGLGVDWRIAASLALSAEGVFCTSGYCSKRPAFTAGFKYITVRHTFALVCGNTTFVTADGYVTNTDRAWSKLGIGFNITRSH
jgi:hypothetical protein